MIYNDLCSYDSGDSEISFGAIAPDKFQLKPISTLSELFSQIDSTGSTVLSSERWRRLKAIVSKQGLKLQTGKGELQVSIQKDDYYSMYCAEEDQDWPAKTTPNQRYSYIMFQDPTLPDPDDKSGEAKLSYVQIRRGLKGRVGELYKLHNGPLMDGSNARELSMRIIKFLRFGKVMLNDDAKLRGMDMRVYLAVIGQGTFYREFHLWENNPPLSMEGEPVAVQKLEVYQEALHYLKSFKIERLRRIHIASAEDMTVLQALCNRYGIEYNKDTTVGALGSVIYQQRGNSQGKTDFATFYSICLTASRSYAAKTYNRKLDTLFRYKFWILLNP